MTETRVRAILAGLAATATAIGLLVVCPAASLAAAQKPPSCARGPQPLALLGSSQFAAFGAASPCNGWAVGSETSGGVETTAIEHWNGKKWALQHSPDPAPPTSEFGGGSDQLDGITVLSKSDVWAAGYVGYAPEQVYSATLILHFNGKHWVTVPSPDPGGPYEQNELLAISAQSAKNIWAVGNYTSGGYQHTLTMHWNGKHWSVVASPAPTASNSGLYSVTMTSATTAWAGGYTCVSPSTCLPALLSWNGHKWTARKVPRFKGEVYGSVYGLSSYGGRHPGVWAVGSLETTSADDALILRWTGRAWQSVPMSLPANLGAYPASVAAYSTTSAVLAGSLYSASDQEVAMVATWNGRRWVFQRSDETPFGSSLNYRLAGVGGKTCAESFAVGSSFVTQTAQQPVAIHC